MRDDESNKFTTTCYFQVRFHFRQTQLTDPGAFVPGVDSNQVRIVPGNGVFSQLLLPGLHRRGIAYGGPLPREEGTTEKGLRTLPASQGQNPALPVLYAPYSLDSDFT